MLKLDECKNHQVETVGELNDFDHSTTLILRPPYFGGETPKTIAHLS